MEQLKMVWTLQELEQQISRQEKKLSNIGSVAVYNEEKKTFSSFEKGIKEREENLKEEKKNLRRHEMELHEITASINELKQKLYSGEMRNVKELESMERKVRSLRKEKGKTEDEILYLMEKIESAEEKNVDEKKKWVGKREQLEKLRLIAKKEVGQAQERLQDLNRRRKDLIGNIDEQLLKKYRELSQRFQGRAVALVKNGFCGVCNVSLPSSFRARILTPGEYVFCENCGCLFVLDD